MPEAARILDSVEHATPPGLTPGPGSSDVLIGMKPAWRAVPAAAAGGMQATKQASDTAIQTAEAATKAATGTPGYAAAKTAEETTKATAATSNAASFAAASGGADTHACVKPLPIPPHGPGFVIDGCATVLVNNLPLARKGDHVLEPVGPPNEIKMGESTVKVG